MAAGQPPVQEQVRGLLERLAGHGMLRVALGAFAVGLFLHVCVLYAVLGQADGKTATQPSRPVIVSTAPAAATVAPTRLPDRSSCDAIRGTDYRSEAERRWFLANCNLALP